MQDVNSDNQDEEVTRGCQSSDNIHSDRNTMNEPSGLESRLKSEISQLSQQLHDMKAEITQLKATVDGSPGSATTLKIHKHFNAKSHAKANIFDHERSKVTHTSANHKPTGRSICTNTSAMKGQDDHRYIPHYITTLPPLDSYKPTMQPMAIKDMIVFPESFLKDFLGGEEWNCGFYRSTKTEQVPEKSLAEASGKYADSMKGAYYLLDAFYEPFLPKIPGEHGARIVVFNRENEEEMYLDVPLFIRLKSEVAPQQLANVEQLGPLSFDPTSDSMQHSAGYIYFGTYSQHRRSDKLDYDCICRAIPFRVMEYWAKKLADEDTRPDWMTEALKLHFCPKPVYQGSVPKRDDDDGIEKGKLVKSLTDYISDLQDWELDAQDALEHLTTASVLISFSNADGDFPPGLRFQWEYLECEGFDHQFYKTLVSEFQKLG